MKNIDLKSLLLGVSVTVLVVVVMLVATAQPPPVAWEYRVVYGYRGDDYQNKINKSALEGWELVSSVGDPEQRHQYAVMKKPRAVPRGPWWKFWKK